MGLQYEMYMRELIKNNLQVTRVGNQILQEDNQDFELVSFNFPRTSGFYLLVEPKRDGNKVIKFKAMRNKRDRVGSGKLNLISYHNLISDNSVNSKVKFTYTFDEAKSSVFSTIDVKSQERLESSERLENLVHPIYQDYTLNRDLLVKALGELEIANLQGMSEDFMKSFVEFYVTRDSFPNSLNRVYINYQTDYQSYYKK